MCLDQHRRAGSLKRSGGGQHRVGRCQLLLLRGRARQGRLCQLLLPLRLPRLLLLNLQQLAHVLGCSTVVPLLQQQAQVALLQGPGSTQPC